MTQTRRLRVLVDAYNIDLRQGTGISTYSRTLAEALEALNHEVHWLFGRESFSSGDRAAEEVTFHDPPKPTIKAIARLQAAGRLVEGFTRSSSQARRFREAGLVVKSPLAVDSSRILNAPGVYRRAFFRHALLGEGHDVRLPEKFDVVHLTTPLPLRVKGAAVVTTIHDLIPLRLPNTTPDDKRKILKLARNSVRDSHLIITVSEASRRDIIEFLNVPEEKVAVTYQSVGIVPLSGEERPRMPAVLGKYGLEQGKFALFVSAIEPKKNLRRLIDAFLEAEPEMPLVIVGAKAWMWREEIGDLDESLGPQARERIRFLGYTTRDDLRFLYSGATFLAFPSLYEGFGLPVAEAMRLGCPVLTSATPALTEVAAGAALLADPLDTGDIRRKIEQMVGDAALRAELARKGLVRAGDFTAERYAERLSAAYARL